MNSSTHVIEVGLGSNITTYRPGDAGYQVPLQGIIGTLSITPGWNILKGPADTRARINELLQTLKQLLMDLLQPSLTR